MPVATPIDLLIALEHVVARGQPQALDAPGFRCDARFLARPIQEHPNASALYNEAPFLDACLDFSRADTILRNAVRERYPEPSRRFVVEARADGERWYGFVTLAGPAPVELPTPDGVRIVADDDWSSEARGMEADIVLGMDLLCRGALIHVGSRSGLLTAQADDLPPLPKLCGGVWCFFLPNYPPIALRPTR